MSRVLDYRRVAEGSSRPIKRPARPPDLRLYSYRQLRNDSLSSLYVPDLAYGRAPPSDERSFASRRERAACLALPRLPCRSQE